MSTVSKLTYFPLTIALIIMGQTACQKAQDQAANTASVDPASGNLAPADQASADQFSSQAQPVTSAPAPVSYAANERFVEARVPPPPLPQYDQPPCPGDDYIWTPGYWSYGDAGYYWVPGAWVMAPWIGALWTPPYWGFDNSVYLWHAGYWGAHIGFYGGVNYGFGYTGRGYYGAYWDHGAVRYNRSVTNINTTVVHNVYNYSVSNSRGDRVSYNGGRGGVSARPTAQEAAAVRGPLTAPLAVQTQHAREAAVNRAQYAGPGRPQPAALAIARPLATPYRAPAARPPVQPVERAAPVTRAQVQPNNHPIAPPMRPAMNRPAAPPENRGFPPARPGVPANRPAPAASVSRPAAAVPPQRHMAPPARQAAPPRITAPPRVAAAPRPAPRPQAERQGAPPRPAPQAKPDERKHQ